MPIMEVRQDGWFEVKYHATASLYTSEGDDDGDNIYDVEIESVKLGETLITLESAKTISSLELVKLLFNEARKEVIPNDFE